METKINCRKCEISIFELAKIANKETEIELITYCSYFILTWRWSGNVHCIHAHQDLLFKNILEVIINSAVEVYNMNVN